MRIGKAGKATTSISTATHDTITVRNHDLVNELMGGLTFTECAVNASSGSLHVDEAMLTPLAVVTGLEFSAVYHTRFAAAQTPLGCVELRYSVLHVVEAF